MSTAPIPPAQAAEYRSQLRHALDADTLTRMGVPVPAEDVCKLARQLGARYPWASTAAIANVLVDVLGTGWGAIYLDWSYRHQGRRAA